MDHWKRFSHAWSGRGAADPAPLYLALADVLAREVGAGRLAAGQRLPPQRELARQLGMDVTTVSRAMREAQQRGLVLTRGRSGSFIASPRSVAAPAGTTIDLSINLPPAPEASFEAEFRDILAAAARQVEARELLGYPMRGRAAIHAQAGARWCAHLKLQVAVERIVVAGGAQQALLGLVALLCQPGDAILTAALTYPGLLAIARKAGVRVVGVEQDEEGVLPEAVDQACRRAKPRLLYLVPTFQNPTTATAGPARRAALAEVVRRRGIALIEDDGHAALLDPGLAPVSALVPERAYYVAGLSKAISPGLRTAYIAAPATAAATLNATLLGLGQFPAPIAARAAAEAIERGVAVRAAAAMRGVAAARWKAAHVFLPELRAGVARTNHFGWLPLPGRWSSEAFAERARVAGVGVTPATAFMAGNGPPAPGVRVCLGAADSLEELTQAMELLARVRSEDPVGIRAYY